MSRPDNFFTEIAGVSTHYARPPVAPYGTLGKPYTFYSTLEFEQKLTPCFEELWETCPLGAAEIVTSAGTWVDKPGFHGFGQAIDVDGIFWTKRDFVTLDYPSDPVFYLGVEAIFRKHFGTVLNYLYNIDHRDHLHIDDGTEVAFYSYSRSRVLFLQAALTHVFDIPVYIDGIYGNQTETAAKEALERIRSSGNIKNKRTWKMLLSNIAKEAFKHTITELSPPELMRHLYQIIELELAGTDSRKRIETALNAFANHAETQKWLNSFAQ